MVNVLLFTEITDQHIGHGRSAGAYRIATEIRKAGYTCQVVDFFTSFTEEETDTILRRFVGAHTICVGFSTTFFDRQHSGITVRSSNRMTTIIEWVKKFNDKIKIVIGGARSHENTSYADARIHGPGDVAIIDYLKFITGKNPFFQYDIKDGAMLIDGQRSIGNFDFNSSMIEWQKQDHLMTGETVPIEVGRGCIFSCSFCSSPMIGKKKLEYVKKPEILREEFIRNYNEFGITRYCYADDTHNDSVDKLERLHQVVTSLPFEIEYVAYLRLDLLNAHRSTATLLRESGLRGAYFGIESLNHASAKAVGKGIHPDKVKEMLNWLRNDVWKEEVSLSGGFIVGLPHDTKETVTEWTDWLLHPDCPMHNFQLMSLWIRQNAIGWKSDFELNLEKYGYSWDKTGNWRNDHFTYAESVAFVAEVNARKVQLKRDNISTFRLLFNANLGFIPKDFLVNPRPLTPLEDGPLILQFKNAYKQRLLG